MDKNTSVKVSSDISTFINNNAPFVEYTQADIDKIKSAYNKDQLEILKRNGVFDGDYEKYYVIYTFCNSFGLWYKADKSYVYKLFSLAKKYNAKDFNDNPYIKNVKIKDEKIGDIFLTNATYGKGEIFQYDEPDFYKDLSVSKLGFCTSDVKFPTIYEGTMPWMSICPSEINSMEDDIKKAHGKVLVLGLGLGYYPYMISLKNTVSQITIVESNEKVIDIFNRIILPQFAVKDKIKVVKADAIEYLKTVKNGDYDFCYADIWESQIDGAYHYKHIKPFEKLLPNTSFAYWIEESIKYYLETI